MQRRQSGYRPGVLNCRRTITAETGVLLSADSIYQHCIGNASHGCRVVQARAGSNGSFRHRPLLALLILIPYS